MDRQEETETIFRKKNQWFPFSDEGMSTFWWGRRWGVGEGEWQQICGYNLQILNQKSNFFTIYERKNVVYVIS